MQGRVLCCRDAWSRVSLRCSTCCGWSGSCPHAGTEHSARCGSGNPGFHMSWCNVPIPQLSTFWKTRTRMGFVMNFMSILILGVYKAEWCHSLQRIPIIIYKDAHQRSIVVAITKHWPKSNSIFVDWTCKEPHKSLIQSSIELLRAINRKWQQITYCMHMNIKRLGEKKQYPKSL